MRVYHFTSAKHGLEDVRLRRLKAATLPDINDPFELAVCSGDPVQRRALRAIRQEWGSRFGMLCFSRDWHNTVLWSHYAEKHRGICLGFDVPDPLLERVRYLKSPPRLNWEAIQNGGEPGEAQMLQWTRSKYEHWAYEGEMRRFVALEDADANGYYFKDFDPTLVLREILVGPISEITRLDLKSVIGNLDGVECCKTRLAFRGYKVVQQKDPTLWR